MTDYLALFRTRRAQWAGPDNRDNSPDRGGRSGIARPIGAIVPIVSVGTDPIGPTLSVRLEREPSADVEERAAVVEYDGDLPREWAEGFALLDCAKCPCGVPVGRWRQFIEDAARFLDSWASRAAGLGWTTAEVFGCHPEAPYARLDCMGLIWLLDGAEILAISAEGVRIRKPSGAMLTIYRRTGGAPSVPVWYLG